MSGPASALLNIHLLRTIIINVITCVVAIGFAANLRKNRDIQVRRWSSHRRNQAPYVHIIVPARNEERNVPDLLMSLLAQTYPAGRWHIAIVDDASTDHTAAFARKLSAQHNQLQVESAPNLPDGWTGKNHAMHIGFQSSPADAEWLLFVDADTRHAPDMLSSAILRAEELGADLLSLIIDVQMDSFWERVVVPQVGELYTLLVGTMDSMNREGGVAAANGQFMLVRRSVYAEIGALPEVIGDVAEDRAIAQACKSRGYTVRLEYGRRLVKARVYASLPEMWAGYSKTLFWASGHNLTRALVVAAALAMYGLLPPAAFLFALFNKGYRARKEALRYAPLQILPMLALRAVICRHLGVPTVYALTYPLGVAVGNAMLLFSAYRVASGKGVQWKGRTYT